MYSSIHQVYHPEIYPFRTYTNRLLPGRLKIRNRAFFRKISALYARKRAQVIKQLNCASWICTTADDWTSKRRLFVGITAHWIGPDLKRQAVCLAVRRVIGKSDFEVIEKILESVYEEFDIVYKLTATVTDNRSNFVKAFRLFGSSFRLSTTNPQPLQPAKQSTQSDSPRPTCVTHTVKTMR